METKQGLPRGYKMAKLLDLIKLAFSKSTLPEELRQDILPDSMQGVVGARSHGNVYLQEGLFYTKADVDEQYESIRHFEFAD